MKIEYFKNYDTMSQHAADLIYHEIYQKPQMILCAASGKSTLNAYQKLIKRYELTPDIFNEIKILKLDEWGGISMDHPQTCETYLQKNLVKPLKISSSRYISFQSNPLDREKECYKVESYLEQNGPIDLCVLGLGMNGHIAFNEPGGVLYPHCHIAQLSKSSLLHSMVKKMEMLPTFGLSIGMADILKSKKIIILLTGSNKNQIARKFLTGEISTELPASFLWLHSDTTCLIDENDIQVN